MARFVNLTESFPKMIITNQPIPFFASSGPARAAPIWLPLVQIKSRIAAVFSFSFDATSSNSKA